MRIKYIYILFALLFTAVLPWQGCQDNFSGGRFDSNDKIQIYDFVKTRNDLTYFAELMDYTDYYSLLSTAGDYTIFIPNDDAFEALFKQLNAEGQDINAIKDCDVEYWRNYIRYHLINKRLETNSFENGILDEPTLLGEDFFIVADIRESYKKIKLNSRSTIIEYNVKVANGIINIVDQVLLPPTKSIKVMLEEQGGFTKMLDIFQRTGLDTYLQDSIITLVVTPDEVMEKYNFDEVNIENLTNWAKYHIIFKQRLFRGELDKNTIYPLFDEQALTFNIDELGKMWCNRVFGFSQSMINGVDNVAENGVYHVLDTVMSIVEALPGIRRHNLYGATKLDGSGNVIYAKNCETDSPAKIYEDTGTNSYHQGRKPPICGWDVTQIGEYFTTVIPDVIKCKYQVRLIYATGNRVNVMLIHNNNVINRDADLEAPNGNFPDYTNLKYKDLGVIEVTERGNVELLFQATHLRRSPSACCDLLMDMIELIPVE